MLLLVLDAANRVDSTRASLNPQPPVLSPILYKNAAMPGCSSSSSSMHCSAEKLVGEIRHCTHLLKFGSPRTAIRALPVNEAFTAPTRRKE